MAVRLALLLIVAGLGATPVVAQSAADTPQTRAARFYAARLEQPLIQLRNGTVLLQACTQRLRRACSKQQRELSTGSRTLELLDALTLFPQRPAEDPGAGVTKPRQLKEKIAATSAALLNDAREYDRSLLARYGAVLRACPGEYAAAQRASLDEQIRIDLAGFQALVGDELASVTDAIAHEEAAVAEELKRSPAGDCAAARELGEFLMQLMHSKLQPWSGEDRYVDNVDREFEFRLPGKPKPDESPVPGLANAVAGNFVSVVATELQIAVFPESAARIKALAAKESATP